MSNASLRTETITSLERLAEIAGSLDQLVQAEKAHFYYESAFFIPWCEAAQNAQQQTNVIAVWSHQDRLAGFVPLCMKRDIKAGMARRLAPPRIGSSPPFDILLASQADQSAVIGAIADHLNDMPWVDLTLSLNLAGSVFATQLAPAMQKTGCVITKSEAAGYLKTSGYASADEFLARFKSKRRMELNRVYKRFLGEVSLMCLDKPEDMPKASALIRDAITNSWKNKAYLTDTFLPLLNQQMLNMSKLGLTQVRFALIDERPIALLVEFISRDGSYNAYYNAHDDTFNSLSPGAGLLQHGIREAFDKGTCSYNFWGNREYIRRLTKEQDDTLDLQILRPGISAGLAMSAMKLAHRIKPPKVRTT